MKYLDVRLRLPRDLMHPMVEFIADEDVVAYEELLTWNVLPDRDVEYELFYVVADRDPYREQVASVDSIRWFELTPIDGDSFYVYVCQESREADAAWREAFAALDILVVPPVRYQDDGSFDITLLGDGENLRAVVDGLPDAVETTVLEVGEYDRRHPRVTSDVTDRQLEAVRAAVDAGYYERPREGSLADIADRLGVAESTASTLLQEAESRVMHALVG
ncbi:bacterio-opsin activator [Halorubellus sp. JP-L1]|uniref:helix-turn-helix domain-containing protein n=1 Tax=Halorubellus sp. JP-L1 TaxID=2715753 RepID=UPI001407D599|nr:helix-turn-helix domain-containing protein [Halorubellus sp. JP-L1]NHN41018.1 bacterio-opsin activator [Halorubellus sp. JP-L1]